MTKKDYERIAAVIAAQRYDSDLYGTDELLDRLTASMAAALKADNARFDIARFIAAANV